MSNISTEEYRNSLVSAACSGYAKFISVYHTRKQILIIKIKYKELYYRAHLPAIPVLVLYFCRQQWAASCDGSFWQPSAMLSSSSLYYCFFG